MIPLMFLQSLQNVEIGRKGPSYVGGKNPLCVSLQSVSTELGFPQSFTDDWIGIMTIIKKMGLSQAELALTCAILYGRFTITYYSTSPHNLFFRVQKKASNGLIGKLWGDAASYGDLL